MIWIGCIDLHKSIYSFEVRKTGRIMKKVIFFLVLSFVVMHSHFAQNNSLRFTQQYLMSHKWYPDIYGTELKRSSVITYTLTQELDSVFKENVFHKVYAPEYYLSDTKDLIFNRSKVGKTISGKYLITELGKENLAYIFEVVFMSEEKMILRNITEGFNTTGGTVTLYTTPI